MQFFLFFRVYQIMYERLQTAAQLASAASERAAQQPATSKAAKANGIGEWRAQDE
jgi:hypothetical protein